MSDVSWVNPPDTLRHAQREEAWFLLLDPQVRPRVRLKREDGGFLFFFLFPCFHGFLFLSSQPLLCRGGQLLLWGETAGRVFTGELCSELLVHRASPNTAAVWLQHEPLLCVFYIYIYIYKYTLRTHWYPPFFLLRRCEHMTRGVTRRPTRWGR